MKFRASSAQKKKEPAMQGRKKATATRGIGRHSKLIVSWLVGGRDADYTHDFMQDVAARLATRVQLTVDGHKPYLQAVADAFENEIDFAQLIKV